MHEQVVHKTGQMLRKVQEEPTERWALGLRQDGGAVEGKGTEFGFHSGWEVWEMIEGV